MTTQIAPAPVKNTPVLPEHQKKMDRLMQIMKTRTTPMIEKDKTLSFAFQFENAKPVLFGQGHPLFKIHFKNIDGLRALSSFDELSLMEGYMSGNIDISGDILRMFDIRPAGTDRHPLKYLWLFIQPLIFGQVSRDKNWISHHYDLDDDFYLSFLDTRHRCYSQAVFANNDESLEDAQTRKLEYALDSIKVKPGDRVLDIGGGWGAFNQFAGKKEIKVTSLTISKASQKCVEGFIKKDSLPTRVLQEHFYDHNPGERYDAIVNLGVTEHLPDYHKSLKKYQALVKPGGRIYLDASACRVKYHFSSFISKYIYEGNATPMCLSDYTAQLAKTPLQLLSIVDDRHNYYLTAMHWARNYEAKKDFIIEKYGLAQFRKFQIYLWGTVDVFKKDIMQAYRVVLQAP